MALSLLVRSSASPPHLIATGCIHPRPSAKLDNFTIAQLSDFHFGPFNEDDIVYNAVQMVNSLQPDAVALTGDFITADHADDSKKRRPRSRAAEILSELTCPERYATLGNHDVIDTESVTDALIAHGIPVLHNESVSIDRNGDRIWMAGLADALFDHPRLNRALPPAMPGQPVILLGHEPDYVDNVVEFCGERKRRVDLFLAGHTHGGQINVPWIMRNVMPMKGEKYIHGAFQVKSTLLYVNRGLGTIHLPLRFRCPPEVTL